MSTGAIQRTFAGGELAPILHARADQAKYLTGLRTCKNFLVRREGGITTRPGLRFVDACKDNTAGHRLMRYVSETAGGSVLIEIGNAYLRFFRNGGAVDVTGVPAYNGATAYVPGDLFSSAGINYYVHTAATGIAPPDASKYAALTGAIYEIPTPYPITDKFKWTQSGNVITITHPSHKPRELVYSSLTRWVLRDITTAPAISAPAGGAGVAGGAGALTYRYKVTSAAIDSYEESNGSAPIVVAAAAKPTDAAPITLSWTADAAAAEYYVYLDPYSNGVYGYVGTAASNSFQDPGFVPDFDLTPPVSRVLFNTTNDYPGTSAEYQQRRVFAFTNREPDSVQMSRVGFRSNFGVSSPLQDDDAVTFRVAGNNHHAVRFLVALKSGLILMTDGGEWTVTGGGGTTTPITPNSLSADQETYVGIAPEVRPVVVGSAILYVQARGSILRELKFEQQVEGLAGRDLTIFASHLFEGTTVTAIDFQQVPDSIIWCVRSDGVLLGLTYVPEQEVWGWHRHTTGAGGLFEDVCVVPETADDVPYVIVARTIGGATKRYIEKLERRLITSFDRDCFFVDSGLSYAGAPASSFSGFDHLNGQIVSVVADGTVLFNGDPAAANAADFTVAAGEIVLAADYRNVHIGLPIRYPEIETLDLDVAGADVRSKRKRVPSLTILVDQSARTFLAGPDATKLRQYTIPNYTGTAKQTSGQLELTLTTSFTQEGRLLIRQSDPLPLTILGVIPQVELGG